MDGFRSRVTMDLPINLIRPDDDRLIAATRVVPELAAPTRSTVRVILSAFRPRMVLKRNGVSDPPGA